MNKEILRRIAEFEAQCLEAQYTDTGDVWILLEWIRDQLKRGTT